MDGIGDDDVIIPGLTNDLALLCLARIPYALRAYARGVCTLWRKVLGGWGHLEQVQEAEGLGQELLCLCLGVHDFRGERVIKFKAYDVDHGAWVGLPPLHLSHLSSWKPGGRHDQFAGYQVVAAGRQLLVMGGAFYAPGWAYSRRAPQLSADVWACHVARRRWSQLRPMSHARSHFMAGALDEHRVLVAGSTLMASAEVLDLREGVWRAAEDMPFPGADTCRAVVRDGQLHAVWHRHPFHGPRHCHVYDPSANAWSTVLDFFPCDASLESSQPMAVLGRRLYAVQGERQSRLAEVCVLRKVEGGGRQDGSEGRGTHGGWERVAKLPRQMRERWEDEVFCVRGQHLAAVQGRLVVVQSGSCRGISDVGFYDPPDDEDEDLHPRFAFINVLRHCQWGDSSRDKEAATSEEEACRIGETSPHAHENGSDKDDDDGWEKDGLQWEVKDLNVGQGVVAVAVIPV